MCKGRREFGFIGKKREQIRGDENLEKLRKRLDILVSSDYSVVVCPSCRHWPIMYFAPRTSMVREGHDKQNAAPWLHLHSFGTESIRCLGGKK